MRIIFIGVTQVFNCLKKKKLINTIFKIAYTKAYIWGIYFSKNVTEKKTTDYKFYSEIIEFNMNIKLIIRLIQMTFYTIKINYISQLRPAYIFSNITFQFYNMIIGKSVREIFVYFILYL